MSEGGSVLQAKKSIEDVSYLLRSDRLSQIGVHAAVQAALPVAFHSMRRHSNDRNVGPALFFLLADFRRGSEPVHFRHLDIHKDHVESLTLQQRNRLHATAGNHCLMPDFLQHAEQHSLVHRIIFSEQDTKMAARLAQRMTGNQAWLGVTRMSQNLQNGCQQLGFANRLEQIRGNAQFATPRRIAGPTG